MRPGIASDSVKRLAAAVCLSLAGIACPVLADPPADAASPPDTAAGAASPIPDVAPSPAEIVALRMRVGDHTARVRLGEYVYDIRGARFESAGVAFDPGRLHVASGGAYYERGPRPSSPIAWDRIDRITVRKPCGTRGAVVGAVVGLGGMVALAVYANTVSHGDPGPGIIIVFAIPPVGAVTGSAIGALITRSEPGWQRGAGARASRGGPVAPAAGPAGAGRAAPLPAPPAEVAFPPSLPIGMMRDEIGGRAIRLRVGDDLYEIRGARLEAAGIAFDAGRLTTLSTVGSAGAWDRPGPPSPPSSPIGWDRVERVEVRAPSALRGAKWGMILLPVALMAGTAKPTGDGSGFASLGGAVLVGVPLGAVVGAAIGALVPHSSVLWERGASGTTAR